MADNSKYYDLYDETMTDNGWNAQLDFYAGIDAVVEAVRAEYFTDDEMYDNGYTDGRQDAARRIRELVQQGASEKEAEHYARIAEGATE